MQKMRCDLAQLDVWMLWPEQIVQLTSGLLVYSVERLMHCLRMTAGSCSPSGFCVRLIQAALLIQLLSWFP